MWHRKHRGWVAVSLLGVLAIMGWRSFMTPSTQTQTLSAVVVKKSLAQNLTFVAELQPKQIWWVVAPVTGHIAKMHQRYGDAVQADAPLMRLEDPDIQTHYVATVTAYLQAKDALSRNQTRFEGEKSLLTLGAISKRDYEEGQSAYEKSYVDWIKAKIKLKQQIEIVGGSFEALDHLKLSDIKAVESTLADDKHVIVRASHEGVLLPASQTEQQKIYQNGSQVKAGDVVAMIVNKDQFSLTIHVSEHQVGALHAGMPVTLSSPVLSGQRLHGVIEHVHTYHVSNQQASLASFPVEISVDTIPESVRNKLHLGMHVTVHCKVREQMGLVVPISAIRAVKDDYVVDVMRADRLETVTVKTGIIVLDDIVVHGDLQEGDRVVLYH